MEDLEVSEIPEESAAAPDEPHGEPEPAAPEPQGPTPEEAAPEPEEPAPEESSVDPEPEETAPEPEVPAETPGEGEVSGDAVQDLITAIGDLNETITGAVTEPEPEQLPAEGDESNLGGVMAAEVSSVDLGPVVQLLERQNDILITQHNDLLQVQANLDFVFLAVCMLAGVMIGCVIGRVLHDLWRA